MEPTGKTKEQLNFFLKYFSELLPDIKDKPEWNWVFTKLSELLESNYSNRNTSSNFSLDGLSKIDSNVNWIASFLKIDIPLNRLADFSNIPNEFLKVKQQLEIDNIQMWRTRYGKHSKDGLHEFSEFCRFAHYQLEELLNLYFFIYEKYRPKELKEYWTNGLASVNIRKEDESFYRNNCFKNERDDKVFVYFNNLTENDSLKHKTKYRAITQNSYKPIGSSIIDYNLKRKLFNYIHFFDKSLSNEKKLWSFEYAEYISKYRNELSHRFSSLNDNENFPKDRNIKYLEFKEKKDFDSVATCINEFIARVKEDFPLITIPE